MTIFTTLKNKILSLLQTVTKLENNNIFDYPKAEVNGYPAAIFYPAEGSVDYETTSEDERVYAWVIEIHYEYDIGGISNALNALYDCVDDVLDKFSTNRMLTGISMPASTVLIGVEPVSAGWGELPNKKILVATINLKIRVSVSSS